MIAIFEAVGSFGWWIAGLVLLVLEIAIPGVYLLFLGIAALIVGTNVLVLGSSGWFGWREQVVAFLIVSVACVIIGRRWYGAASLSPGSSALNRPAERFTGRIAVVSDAIVEGRGRVALDDGWWMVEGPDMAVGGRVRIVGSRGSVLIVVPAD